MGRIAKADPNFIAVEPDQARERVVNMLRHGVQFCVEIDPTMCGMKDVVVISRTAKVVEREGFTLLRQRAVGLNEACHFAMNCIREELTYQCTPEMRPNDADAVEYLFLVELRSDGRKGA